METIVTIVLLWIALNGLLGLVVGLATMWTLKINLPKSKKYSKLKDPIYKIEESYGSFYNVVKYDIRYGPGWFLFGLLPFPIEFHTYGYHRNESFRTKFKIAEQAILEFDIEHFYEEQYSKALKECKGYEDEALLRKTILKEKNKEFKDNYGSYS